jgi:nucleolar pre-ribosomal-associated protein 1
MEIFRARNIFERILSFYVSPICWSRIKEKILRLLFRAAAVGGSTTLIARSGILSWIQAQVALNDGHEVMLRRLASRLFETCDQMKVHEWSSGRVKKMVEGLAEEK